MMGRRQEQYVKECKINKSSRGKNTSGPRLKSSLVTTEIERRNSVDSPVQSSSHRKRKRRKVYHSIEIEPSKKVPFSKSGKVSKHYRSAKLDKLKHPLEENIFTSLIITLIAVSIALICGVPILLFIGALLITAVTLRYLTVILQSCFQYLRYVCSNQNVPTSPQRSFPLSFSRLAFANDVKWLAHKGPSKCQSISHTVLIFEGSLELSHLRHLITTRVLNAETPDGELIYPRLTQKIISFLGGYRWDPDTSDFDVTCHIYQTPQMKTEKEVQNYLSELVTQCLPICRPLWEIQVVPNYGSQRDTLAILRVHQSLADGMTLVRILSHSLADRQQLHIPQRPHFAGLSFGFNAIRSFIVGPLTLFLWVFMTSKDINFFTRPLKSQLKNKKTNERKKDYNPTKSTTQLLRSNDRSRRSISQGNTANNPGFEGIPDPNSVPLLPAQTSQRSGNKITSASDMGPNSNNQKSSFGSGGWEISWAANMTVPKVGRIKQIMRSSFNDVLLACAAGSLRKYVQCQGVQYPDDFKVVIPVDLRNDMASPSSTKKLGCKVASILATIPVCMESAIARLWATRHRLDEVKASPDPLISYFATTILINLLPLPIASYILDHITNKASIQFCNLPGPTSTVVVGGYPLKSIYPIYPPTGNIKAGVTVFSYADQVHVTAITHNSLPNASNSLLVGMSKQIDQLASQLSHRRVPGESRRSARNASTANSEITKPPTKQIHFKLQVVQEELQQITHQLDSDGLRLSYIPMEVSNSIDQAEQIELRTRLRSLKSEFSELMCELRRRSSIVEGVAVSFEDEEMEEDFRKPRKRALSVVSMSRRGSLFPQPRHLLIPSESSNFENEEEDSSVSSPGSGSELQRHTMLYSPPRMRSTTSPIRTTAV